MKSTKLQTRNDMVTFETRILKMISRFIFLLALFSLPSISANTDCGGMPFSCVNSTYFKICVDFGNGISRTVDDFVIPCPPGTECRLTNHFECEASPASLGNTSTEKEINTTNVANHTKYKDERSVVTPMTEELHSANPHEVQFSEKYLHNENPFTLADESLSTTNVVFDVIAEITTESMFVTSTDIIPFYTTTMKNVGVTERNLKESADFDDLMKGVKSTTFYPGYPQDKNTEHTTSVPEIITTSEVISPTYSENPDVISTTVQYAVEYYSQVGGPNIITTESKVSNSNDNFVEATTSLNLEISELDYSTPMPMAENPSTSNGKPTTDDTEGLNNLVSPPNVYETTVQNDGIDFAFTTERNDVNIITLSLTPTDTTTDDVKIVNTGIYNDRNSDLSHMQGNKVEGSTAATESYADVTFDTLTTNPDELTTNYISEVTLNKIELITDIPQETANTVGIKIIVTPSIIVNGNVPTSTESITRVQVNTRPIFNLNNNVQQVDGNSRSEVSQTYASNKEEKSVEFAKDISLESVGKKSTENDKLQPTAVVNGDDIPPETNLYSWYEQQYPINVAQVPVQTDTIAKDRTTFEKTDGQNKYTGIDLSGASIDQSVAAEIIKSEQRGSKLKITRVAPSSISRVESPKLQKNEMNFEETEAQQVRTDSGTLTHVEGANEVVSSAVKNSTQASQLDQVPYKIYESKTQQSDLVGVDEEAPHTLIEVETQQFTGNTVKTTKSPQANVDSPLNQDTDTFIASTLATMSQVPTPISEGDVNVNKPTASGVQGVITESLSQTPSYAPDSTSQQKNLNSASLDQPEHLPGHGNVAENCYGNVHEDGTLNIGSNGFSQPAPSSITTSPWTETNIGFDESLLLEVENANNIEEALHTVSIAAAIADKTTSQVARTMTESTDFTAPATVIIGNKMASSTPEIVLESASGATSGVTLTSPKGNTVSSPTKSSSIHYSPVEVKSETASLQNRNVTAEESMYTVKVADAIRALQSISKTMGPSEGKARSLSQPPSIKDETTAETSNKIVPPTAPAVETNVNQPILKGNNVAPPRITKTTVADLTHSPNDHSTFTPFGEIPVNERIVPVAGFNNISTKPTNVEPRPDPSILHQASQSPVMKDINLFPIAAEQSIDGGQNPKDKVVANQQNVDDLEVFKTPISVSNPIIFDISNTQVPRIPSIGVTNEFPATRFNKSLMTKSTSGSGNSVDTVQTTTLSPLTTTERIKLAAPNTNAQDVIFHQEKVEPKESEYGETAKQEVNKSTVKTSTVTIAPTLSSKSTSATPSVSIVFSCSNLPRGRYSDKDDCRKFHICIDQQDPIVGYCPDNTVFSEIKKQCTKNLSHCVRSNEFQCVSPGRYSDYLLKNVYYICVKNHHSYYRFKFQCQTGFYLNKLLVRCIPHIESSVESVSLDDVSKKDSDQRDKRSTAISTSTTTSTSTSIERIVRRTKKPKESKSSTTTERNQRRNRDECEEVGKFPHPDNCRKYYVCYKTSRSQLRRRRKKCDSDELFHKDKRKCVDAESYECDL